MIVNKKLYDENWEYISNELNGESERACAIVGGEYLNNLLEEILKKYLIKNGKTYKELLYPSNQNAPLGTFNSRIVMAYSIGLFDKKIREYLDTVRTIRNRFSHKLKYTFRTEEIKKLYSKFDEIFNEHPDFLKPKTKRDLYLGAIAFLTGFLKIILHLNTENNISGNYDNVIKLHRDLAELNEIKKYKQAYKKPIP